jgi:hypothetical protein
MPMAKHHLKGPSWSWREYMTALAKKILKVAMSW